VSTIRVSYSTMGQSSPATVRDDAGDGEGGYYHYKRDPDWFPNDPRYYPERAEAPDELHPANAKAMAGRKERLAEFAGYLDQGLTAQQAGKLIGIAPKTAKAYERELKDQQRGETAQ